MSKGIVHLTHENFDECINNNDLVCVDFWADWCMPCTMLTPIIEKLADEYKGKVIFAKVDVNTESELSSRFKIMNIPAIFILKKGNVIESIIGLHDVDFYKEVLDKNI